MLNKHRNFHDIISRSRSVVSVNGRMWCHGKCFVSKALWGSIFSFPFIKEGPVVPKLKEVIKKVCQTVCREASSGVSWDFVTTIRYYLLPKNNSFKKNPHRTPYFAVNASGVTWPGHPGL